MTTFEISRGRNPPYLRRLKTIALLAVLTPLLVSGLQSDFSPIAAAEPSAAVDAPTTGTIEDTEDPESIDEELDSLLDTDLGSLRRTSVAPSLDIEVSSVSRQKSTIGRSPAAVFVITNEMIRRSGYQSIPEILRLAPGVQVARIDGNKWSVSVRGESGRFSDKLLVQIDGRSIYNPLFAGVLWDIQDVLLEDVLRIEVIRGPGATVWGANAVNGVINIITKTSHETHGSYAKVGSGSLEQGFASARIGGNTKGDVHYRIWGKWFQRDDTDLVSEPPNDSIKQGRLGFRTDWTAGSSDTITLQGEYYASEIHTLSNRDNIGRLPYEVPAKGGNLLTRWTRKHSECNESAIQLYYDRFDRESLGFGQSSNVFDLDYQNRFHLQEYHSLIWGLGYRAVFDKLVNNEPIPLSDVSRDQRTVQRFSGFIQDEMTLLEERLYLTVGAKLSHNTFSESEIQPSARLLWLPDDRSAVWGAVSRAVRTPSRASADGAFIITQPTPPFGPFTLRLFGDSSLGAENLISYEIGARKQLNDFVSYDATAYFNNYDNLHQTRIEFPSLAPPHLVFSEGAKADAYGFELSANFQLESYWLLQGWYAFQRIDYGPTTLPNASGNAADLPRNQLSITNSFDLSKGRQLDLITRYVDNVPGRSIPAYVAADVRYSWIVGSDFSLSIVGRNLFDPRHPEFGANRFTGDISTEVPRSFHAYLEWRR